jgi:2-oxoglutarate ferredoxin oxidoreductase subunit gamma
MVEKLIIAGAGGQGVMLLGKILVAGAMQEGKYVTWLPAYGAEVRGGAAYCMVVISDVEIGSPYIDKADTLIIMNAPSYVKFKGKIKNNGLLFLNSSLIDIQNGKNVLKYPFTDIAESLGNGKIANMVALGCYLVKCGSVKIKSALLAIEENAPADKKGLVEINQQALIRGVDLIHGKS